MTIAIAFHGSGARTFKDFYTLTVIPHWRKAFPHLVSYMRFVELMPWCLLLLCGFATTRKGEIAGIALIDSTPIAVCHPARAKAHKVFKLTPANTDDRQPVPEMTQDLFGQLFGVVAISHRNCLSSSIHGAYNW
jgi:hypothetical protein